MLCKNVMQTENLLRKVAEQYICNTKDVIVKMLIKNQHICISVYIVVWTVDVEEFCVFETLEHTFDIKNIYNHFVHPLV